ncbi:MAG TPA: glycosyltransferase family 2 protein [Thermoplasmata archaeon]|nr:glycosyltransferase family 2 protein [Thermoplasmata archaeon]
MASTPASAQSPTATSEWTYRGGPTVLAGGIVAHNEVRHLEAAVRSLLEQELPPGVRWGTIWVISSGSTDGTADLALRLASKDDRVRVVIEPERKGKSAAIAEILRRASGALLVLLNADAVAAPRSVVALLERADGLEPPFAVMGRPLPPARPGAFASAIELLWELHHRLHVEALTQGVGTHLSDELLLLSLEEAPPLEAGIINDGAFVGAWLSSHAGTLRYSTRACVAIDAPTRWRDHLGQRRRIHFGHRQVSRLVGVSPTTLPGFLRRHPRAAAALLRRALRARPDGIRSFAYLASAEAAAFLLSGFDHVRARNHVLWTRISSGPELRHTPPAAARTLASEAPSVSAE